MSLFQPIQLAAAPQFRGEEGSRNPGQPAVMPQEGAPAEFPQEGRPAEFPNEGRPALFPGEAAPEQYSYIGDPIVDKYIHSFIGMA